MVAIDHFRVVPVTIMVRIAKLDSAEFHGWYVFFSKSYSPHFTLFADMQNQNGKIVDLYLPRRWYVFRRLVDCVATGPTA